MIFIILVPINFSNTDYFFLINNLELNFAANKGIFLNFKDILESSESVLNHLTPIFNSYRNQTIDLLWIYFSESVVWFLYENENRSEIGKVVPILN